MPRIVDERDDVRKRLKMKSLLIRKQNRGSLSQGSCSAMSCAGANLVPCRRSVQASDQYILLATRINWGAESTQIHIELHFKEKNKVQKDKLRCIQVMKEGTQRGDKNG